MDDTTGRGGIFRPLKSTWQLHLCSARAILVAAEVPGGDTCRLENPRGSCLL